MDFENNRVNEAKIWKKRAEAALIMAEKALKAELYPESSYHSQQACEKTLKTILILFGEDVNEHKITSIFADMVSYKFSFDFDKIITDAFELERHWLSSRYPIKRTDGSILNPDSIYTKKKSEELYKKAKEIYNQINLFLKQEFNLEL